MYNNMCEILNEGEAGEFKLTKYTIEKGNFYAWRDCIPEGEYIRLTNRSGCMMSNTPMEKRTNRDFIRNANGDVFIAGLGIGLIVLPIQDNENIKSITILEKNQEIIDLVGSQLPLNDKVKIICGDVFNYEFPKGTKFDTIYFDIWDYVNSDVYEEMKELKKKYRKYRRSSKENPNVYVKCWAEYQAKNNLRLI